MFSIFFFVSGFCSLLYQIVWLRLAMGYFGVIAPVLSVVLSVFMLGLGLGSWASGRWLDSPRARRFSPKSLLALYGILEGTAAIGGSLVPVLFKFFDGQLSGVSASPLYLAGSAVAIGLSLVIPCLALGATTPTALAYARASGQDITHGFSWLYLANLIGALCGATLTPYVLIEILGFHKTLACGLLLQSAVSIGALMISFKASSDSLNATEDMSAASKFPVSSSARAALLALFITGFVSMACEVLWTRIFTAVIGTTIYAFAGILTVYLVMYAVGVGLYRFFGKKTLFVVNACVFAGLPLALMLPLFLSDPHFNVSPYRLFASLAPFCLLLGWLTPGWVDRYCLGDPRRAGFAYGVNVLGCVLGPLAAGYWLLPLWGTKAALMGLAGLLSIGSFWAVRRHSTFWAVGLFLFGIIPTLAGGAFQSLEIPFTHKPVVVRRDYAATVISAGSGMDKFLCVNGVNLTVLTPLTKIMAHLPVIAHTGKPQTALTICFGMGTTFRSLLSWGLDTTAVELVPSVPQAFGYYFSDAADLVARPNAHIVIDDGRRFLKRTQQKYDIIALDPPPPVECAASGFLYSDEFYVEIKKHLAPQGVMQQWWPGGEVKILQSVARSFLHAFPYVRVYKGLGGRGFHFLGSETPLRPLQKSDWRQMPPKAYDDFTEWIDDRKTNTSLCWEAIIRNELAPQMLVDPHIPRLTDDRPFNEYFLLRRHKQRHGEYAYTL